MALPIKRFNDDTIDALTRYIENGGESSGIELGEKHKETLLCIRFADEKLRENKHKRETVATYIREKFEVSRDTAWRYLVMAERIFSSTTPLNKKYEIGLRIEKLKSEITAAFEENDRIGAAMLEKLLQKYIEIYPDYKEPRSPKNITFIINGGIHQTNNNLTVAQAANDADALLIQLEEKEDY